MRFTLSWLKRFLDTDATLEKIAHTLTMTGLEIEDIDDKSESLKAFEVAEIIETKQHPDADKLKVCVVKTKSGELQIVCGAPNARAGIKVVLANVGTIIPNGDFKIKKSKIRGVESVGMLCSSDEIDLPGDSSGIIELKDNAVIGDNIAKYMGVDDPVLHINITPNRADALGVYGIARDLCASGIGALKKLTIPSINESYNSNVNLTNNDTKACPFFAVREIKGLENKDSPEWLKNYLDNVGIGSISTLVDVTNYISYTFGQPMHVYDADKISGGLTVETLPDKAAFKALNDKEYILESGDIIIRDEKEIHSVAGIIGGINSSCSENTTNVILEAASFNSRYIAKTGRKMQIDTDSRYRFERNVNSEFTQNALDIATDLILSICGGSVSKTISTGNSILPIRTIDFPVSFLKSRTNVDLNEKEISNILIKLGFECQTTNNIINIIIPSWRYDVSIKEDIVEEIVRIYGYDKLLETPLPVAETSCIIPKDQKRISDIKRLIASSGYTEVVTWSFMDSTKAKLFSKLKDELSLQNPISADLDYMRPSILPNLLKTASNNLNRSFFNISLFEVGPIFENSGDKVINHACAIRIGEVSSKNSHGNSRKFDVFDMKADIAILLKSVGLDINRCQIKDNTPEYYHPTRSASLSLGKNIIGYFGQVHPSILKMFEIDVDVMVFEINISSLPYGKNKFGKRASYIVSDYQKITRDYAFIVNDNQPVGEILNFIQNTDKKLVRSVEIFDIYSGNNIEAGKKSVALSVNIQDDNKTLVEDDIEKINKAIIDGVVQKFGAVLRNS